MDFVPNENEPEGGCAVSKRTDDQEQELEAIEVILETISSSIGVLHLEVSRLDRLAWELSDVLMHSVLEHKPLDEALRETDTTPSDFCMAFDVMAGICEHLAAKSRAFTARFVSMQAEEVPEPDPN